MILKHFSTYFLTVRVHWTKAFWNLKLRVASLAHAVSYFETRCQSSSPLRMFIISSRSNAWLKSTRGFKVRKTETLCTFCPGITLSRSRIGVRVLLQIVTSMEERVMQIDMQWTCTCCLEFHTHVVFHMLSKNCWFLPKINIEF